MRGVFHSLLVSFLNQISVTSEAKEKRPHYISGFESDRDRFRSAKSGFTWEISRNSFFSYFISRFDKFHAVISCNRKPFVQETPAVFSFGGCSHLLKEVLLNDRTSAIEPVLLLLTT